MNVGCHATGHVVIRHGGVGAGRAGGFDWLRRGDDLPDDARTKGRDVRDDGLLVWWWTGGR